MPARTAPLRRVPLRRNGADPQRRKQASAEDLAQSRLERLKMRFERDFGGEERHSWLVSFPCCACGETSEVHAHHVRSRGAGGAAEDMVPLCWSCHSAVHTEGPSLFEHRRGVDLVELAAYYAHIWATRPAQEVPAC